MRTLAVAILSLSLAVGLLAVDALGRPRETVPPSPAICTAPPSPSPVLGPPTPVEAPLVGIASWYGNPRKWGEPTVAWYTRKTKHGDPVVFYAAAGPKLRDFLGDPNPYLEHYPLLITNPKTGKTILIVVVDWCSCSKGKKGEKLVDLSPAAFLALGVPLSRGIQKVYISRP
jgi:hypothetical protein